jgi:predicted amidohydrolase
MRAIGLPITVVLVAVLWAAIRLPLPDAHLVAPVRTVRVAAIQCPSQMGKISSNQQRLKRLITEASRRGAKIVVLPECAVSGYFDPLEDRKWSSKAEPGENELPVSAIAEHIPGESTRFFSALAKELSIYVTVPLAEADRGHYYNSVALIDPSGILVARHRKRNLWSPGDSTWAKCGTGEPQVVATPYGRLGLMICYDVHVMAQRLKGKADIVLYSVGWYGPNTEGWYRDIFPERYVKPNGFAVIAANWSAESTSEQWQGAGYSTIFARDGTVLAGSNATIGEEIVIADIQISEGAAIEEYKYSRTADNEDD